MPLNTDNLRDLANQTFTSNGEGEITGPEVREGFKITADVIDDEIAQEKSERQNADNSLTNLVRSSLNTFQGRPGELPDRYTTSVTGDRSGAGIPYDVQISSNGRVVSITGSGIIALRDRINLTDGKAHLVKATYRRITNPTDPAGGNVRLRIQWLNFEYGAISQTNILSQTLTVANGLREIEASIGRAGSGADHIAPSGTVYAVVYIETFDVDGVTHIERLEYGEPINVEQLYFPTPYILPPEILPDIPPDLLPDDFGSVPVARTFYVTANGDDGNNGDSLGKPLATPEAALVKMINAGEPCITIMHPGEYTCPPDAELDKNCTLYGVDGYGVRIGLPAGEEENNMILMDGGTKVRGITFQNLRHEEYDFDPASKTYAPPRKGFATAFKPGAFITRLPYVMDCAMRAAVADDLAAMYGPTDRAAANPFMPRGGGCMIADPSVLDPNSPQKVMCAFSFTSINPNGVAYVTLDDAFVQLVSIYTNYARLGFWSHGGGQMTVKNGDCTFGDWSLAATGFRAAIQIPDTLVSPPGASVAHANAIDSNIDAILANAETRWALRSWWAGLSSAQRAFTRRDARTLLEFLSNDRRSGQALGVQAFTKGLFDKDAQYVFNPSLLTAFLQSYDDIEDAIVSVTGITRAPLTTLISVVKTVLTTPANFRVTRGSRILAQPHGMSNCGAGVNYNARPFDFRGTGFVPEPDETIVENDGGLVDVMWMREQGDMRLARDLYVRASTSTIEGRAFRRSVQATTLPLIVALSGLGRA